MTHNLKDCAPYHAQIERAKEMLRMLEDELFTVRGKLQANPDDAMGTRELKRINLEVTITLNELEHSQYMLDRCVAKRAVQQSPVAE